MAATLPRMAYGFGTGSRLGASALIVTLLTTWAWFDVVERPRATGVAALSVQPPVRLHGPLSMGRPERAAPTPGTGLFSVATLAETEGLLAHRNAVEIRFEDPTR